jgi:hypothetical protein
MSISSAGRPVRTAPLKNGSSPVRVKNLSEDNPFSSGYLRNPIFMAIARVFSYSSVINFFSSAGDR